MNISSRQFYNEGSFTQEVNPSKEWMNRDQSLKELEDVLIPSSQSCIEWQSSDEDNKPSINLKFKKKSSCKNIKIKSITQSKKVIMSNSDSLLVSHQISKTKSVSSILKAKASYFSSKLPKSNNSIQFPNIIEETPLKIKDTYIKSINKKSRSNAINKTIDFYSEINKSTVKNSLKSQEVFATSPNCTPTSPIMNNKLMSRISLSNHSLNHSGRINFNLKVPEFKCENKSKNLIKNLDEFCASGICIVNKNEMLNFDRNLTDTFHCPSPCSNTNMDVSKKEQSLCRSLSPVFESRKKRKCDTDYNETNLNYGSNVFCPNKTKSDIYGKNLKRNFQTNETDMTFINNHNVIKTTVDNVTFSKARKRNILHAFKEREIQNEGVNVLKENLNTLQQYLDHSQKNKNVITNSNKGDENSGDSVMASKQPRDINDNFNTEPLVMELNKELLPVCSKKHICEEIDYELNSEIDTSSTNDTLEEVNNFKDITSACIVDDNSQHQNIDSSILIDSSSPVCPRQKLINRGDCWNLASLKSVDEDNALENRTICQIEKKGSTWIKDIQAKTPEKMADFQNSDHLETEPPDSTKKKLKKEGLADHFRKVLQSWHSDISMWNHQMGLIESHQLLNCCDSPIMGNGFSVSDKKLSPLSSLEQTYNKSESLNMNFSHSFQKYDRLVSRLKANSEKVDDASSVFKLESIKSIVDIKSPRTPHLANSLRKLRSSLDVSPALSLSLSNCKKFSPPKKHICLQITSVSKTFLSSEAVSLECVKINQCNNKPVQIKCNEKTKYNISNSISDTDNKNIENSGSSLSLCMQSSTQFSSKKFLVILNQFDIQSSKKLQIGDNVKIFAPWEVLDIKEMPLPTIFSSYFAIKSCEFECVQTKPAIRKRIHLATWSCACVNGKLFVPSMCSCGELKLFSDELATKSEMKETKIKEYGSIKDKEKFSLKIDSNCIWTVFEAIEQSGGKPDVFVQITARILRVIPSRKGHDDRSPCKKREPFQFTIVAQDPSGIFFTIYIPNRPLTSTLQTLIEEGVGTTQTISYLTVGHRITDSQDPALFSLISYLHGSYHEAVQQNVKLKILLKNYLMKPLQTYCYKFCVCLGKTKNTLVSKNEGLYVREHLCSVEEAYDLQGQRGKLTVNILYYLHPYLYVTCRKKSLELNKHEDSSELNILQIYKLTVKDLTWLPPWMGCDGTVMCSAIIRDIFVTKAGILCLDDYSSIIRTNTDFHMGFLDLIKLLPPLNSKLMTHDLVVAKGVICGLNEEEAYSWQECEFCDHYELLLDGEMLKCQKCGEKNINPLTKYSLEVFVIDQPSLNEKVKIKLYQKTIESLLKHCRSTSIMTYDPSALLGRQITSLVCVVKSMMLNGNNVGTKFSLTELPY